MSKNDKADEKLNETLDGNEDLNKDQDDEFKPIEWLNSLVEQNQDDTEFIVQAQRIKELITKNTSADTTELTDLQNKVSSLEKEKTELENQNAGLKKRFYDTFMGVPNGAEHKEDDFEDVKKEESPLTLNDIVNMIKKGV